MLSPPSSPSPFTAKAAALRYRHWKNPHHRPLPPFLLSKLSTLSLLSSAALSSTISSATPLPSFLCSVTHLLCSSHSHSAPSPSDFNYNHANFSSYGDSFSDRRDAFKIYSAGTNSTVDSFRRYSLRSTCLNSSDANIASTSFSSYAAVSFDVAGSFSSYTATTNNPDLCFSSYDPVVVCRPHTFSSYSSESNSGSQRFSSYCQLATASPATFTTYATDANVLGTGFVSYSEATTWPTTPSRHMDPSRIGRRTLSGCTVTAIAVR